MKIDCDRICSAFPDVAWAYAESYDAVRIGRWDGKKLVFIDTPDEELMLTLRVFTESRELRFSGDRCRDTEVYAGGKFISSLADAKYCMYGEQQEPAGGYTKLWEERGGMIYFPAVLDFPNGNVGLKLGIKNFVRYNPVPVCPQNADFHSGLDKSGAGAIEVIDYAYTGFYYADAYGKSVEK